MTKEEKFNLLVKFIEKSYKEKLNKFNFEDNHRIRLLKEIKFFKKNESLVNDALFYLKEKKIGGDKNPFNSFVFFIIGVTNKEPDYSKDFNFSYELTTKRYSAPDIDIDFDHREPILRHICEFYGEEKVALMGNVQTYKSKASIQLSAKALDITKTNDPDSRRFSSENVKAAIILSKTIPDSAAELPISSLIGEDNFDPPNRDVKEAILKLKEENRKHPEIFESAKSLEGMFSSYGTHAAGVVISFNDITDDIPLHRTGKTIVSENNEAYELSDQEDFDINLMTTQFDMEDVEDLGLLKFDFLQIETLRVIRLTENLILESNKLKKLPFDIDKLETNDPKVFKTIDSLKLHGLFQISGSAFVGKEYYLYEYGEDRELKRDEFGKPIFKLDENGNKIKKRRKGLMAVIGCKDFNDIVASNALVRPGPLNCNMHVTYAENKKNPDNIKYPHPKLKDILKESYGMIIYQEQLIKMAMILAGLSFAEADKIRKGCGKKILSLLEEVKPKFFEGCQKNNINNDVSKRMWDIAMEFGQYGFNKSHCVAYSLLTYQTAYLKTYYPTEFICSYLTFKVKNKANLEESIIIFKEEYKKLEILNPDINKSKKTYIPNGKMKIISPFLSIKGVGQKVSDHIVDRQPFDTFGHFLCSIDRSIIDSKTLRTLIHYGCFESICSKEDADIEIKKYDENIRINKSSKPKSKISVGDLF